MKRKRLIILASIAGGLIVCAVLAYYFIFPRLVRVANYEEGVTGRHDAAKILGPFVQSLLHRHATQKVAILLHDAGSSNKLAQSIVEMIRGGLGDLPVEPVIFHAGEPLDDGFVRSLPFNVRALRAGAATVDEQFCAAVREGRFDYVVLFESSGMYRGEDIVSLASHLTLGRLDAVWGSRRLSVRDVQALMPFYEDLVTEFFPVPLRW